ncbi:MAG: hypothetical protein HFF70_10340 [Oscillospiraceae bacterium]|nr:hypothetical protein [Oscillospiraceae bacterium]
MKTCPSPWAENRPCNRAEIRLENITPILTPEQEAAKRQELEQRLYEVFRKYASHRQTEEPAS